METIEQEKVEPKEVDTLREIFQKEYPDAEINFVDYSDNQFAKSKEILSPEIQDTSEDVFIKPMGAFLGNYRLPLFLNGIKNRLPDPENPENSYILYPSFDKDNKVKTLRILRYPQEILDRVIKETNKEDFTWQESIQKSYQKHKEHMVLPTVRKMITKGPDSYTFTEEIPTPKSSMFTTNYPSERLERIRKGSKPLPWGNKKELFRYANKNGNKRILIVSKENET
jgi:hypothetical protein